MHTLFSVGVALGLVGGMWLGYVVTRRAVDRMAKMARATIVRGCAVAAAVFAVIPASFYAFVLGGNFGGAWAAFLLGEWAVAIGIGFGIALALAICIFVAAVLGGSLGVVISRALGKERAA
ncbi:MAG: hypothetical protein U1F54_09155 [Burkholderiales bacterium]